MHQHEVAGPDAALMQPGGEAVQAFGKGAVGPGFGLTLEGFPKNERVARPGARLRVALTSRGRMGPTRLGGRTVSGQNVAPIAERVS